MTRERRRIRTMRLKSRYLGVIFILAVILPSILLAVLSVRATGREEAYIEKQVQTALMATVTHTAVAADAEVRKAAEELRESLEVPTASDPRSVFSRWKGSSSLVGVPFLLSAQNRLLWPEASAAEGSPERLFLQENSDFLTGKTSTTLYRNIAVVYKDEILAESRKIAADKVAALPAEKKSAVAGAAAGAGSTGSATEPAPAASASSQSESGLEANREVGNVEGQTDMVKTVAAAKPSAQAGAGSSAANTEVMKPLSDATFDTLQKRAAAEEPASPAAAGEESAVAGAVPQSPAAEQAAAPIINSIESQQAINAFQESEAIRQKVYQQAKEKGDSVPLRNVNPQVQAAVEQSRQSQLVTETGTFSKISSGADFGIIPRFIGERLAFIFWSRQKDGRIAGCSLDTEAFRARIAGVVTEGYSDTRILAILDERGEPLVVPTTSPARDWRRPFVSREIGESLPRWEAASYLTDPLRISSQARASSLVIWIMVLILFVSVSGGGTLVLRSLASEVRLARNKSTFVTNVSHELKTPLTSIGLFVELLRKGKRKDPATLERYLTQISAETERLTRLINNVLDFSAMERGTKRYTRSQVDAIHVCRKVVDGQRVRLERDGFTVTFIEGGRGVIIHADEESLAQAVLNLVSNAEKYSPAAKEIEVEVASRAGWAEIHVRDRGAGVPDALREKIFQEFYRVDDSLTTRVKGTGLGLTIARRIIRDHGGDITCAPRPGGGSDFTIRLPPYKHDAAPWEGE